MLHHPKNRPWKMMIETYLKDITFGIEDGIVSTFGVLIGVAIGAHDTRIVLLTGLVVITVEALSMAVGTFLSARSEKERVDKILKEELEEIRNEPEKERLELIEFYTKQGFTRDAAAQMAETIRKDETVMLEEMAHHELKIFPDHQIMPVKNAVIMWLSYAIGGSLALVGYFLFPLPWGSLASVMLSMSGLFVLGIILSYFSDKSWWRLGLETLALSVISGMIGFIVGTLARHYLDINSVPI